MSDEPIVMFGFNDEAMPIHEFVDRIGSRPMTDDERARLFAHLQWIEYSALRANVSIRIPFWGIALGAAIVALFLIIAVDPRTDVRKLASIGINALAIAACAPSLMTGRPLPVGPSIVGPELERARQDRRTSWGLYGATWIILTVNAIVLLSGFFVGE